MAAKRTVSVALDVDAVKARKDIRATKDDIAKLIAATEGAGKSLDDLATDAAQAGRKLDDMAEKAAKADRRVEDLAAGTRRAKVETAAYKRELGQLDRQIDATVLHLKTLGRQFADTGDKALLKQITADRNLLAKMAKIRKDLLPDSVTPTDVLDLLPIKGVAIGIAAAVAAAAAAPVGAAIAGAVVGGVGLGGIVGGVLAAAHDGRVKDAYAELGHGLSLSLKEAGQPFIGPLVHEVSTLSGAAHSGINILRDGFLKLAPLVRPLALGIDGFVEALGPGLSHAFSAAQPAIRALAHELPEIGDAISDAFDAISKDDRATEGLIGLLHVTEDLVRGTGEFIGMLSWEFDQLVKLGAELDRWDSKLDKLGALKPQLGFGFEFLTDSATNVQKSFKRALDTSDDFAHSLDGTATSADDAAQAVKDLQNRIDDLFAAQLSWDEAQISLREGMRDLVAELTHGKKTLAETSAEGDKNREAIIRQVKAVVDAAESYRRWSGDIAGANAKRDEELERIRNVLIQLGYNKTAVDAIVNAYKNIPVKASTPVEAPGLATVQSRLNKVQAMLDRLDGRVVRSVVATDFYSYRHDEVAASRRWGGISERSAVRYAETGLLRDAAVYSAHAPARYAFAEPATGGEAFIPKRGDARRSMSILDRAAQWYGASVVPSGYMRGSSAAAAPPINIQVTVAPGGHGSDLARALMSTLRTEIGFQGGDVQAVLGRGLGGSAIGRYADILRRGG